MGCIAGLPGALRARAIVASVLLGLGLPHCHSSSASHRDALAMFQVTKQYHHQQRRRQESERPGHGAKELARRRQLPLELGDSNLRFVASVEYAVGFLGSTIKCQKLAMYLGESCPVWVNTTSNAHALSNKDLFLMLGNVRIVMVFESALLRILPRSRILSRMSTVLAEELEEEHGDAEDYAAVMDNFTGMLTQSPPLRKGSQLSFEPSRTGVRLEQDGELLGTTYSSYLGAAFIEALLGERAYTTVFRDKALDQLRTGYPDSARNSAQVTLHSPWWVALIFFLVIAALLCIILVLLRSCCLFCCFGSSR